MTVKKSNYSISDDSELVPGETDPSDVGVPHGLIYASQLRKIIACYNISLDFIY